MADLHNPKVQKIRYFGGSRGAFYETLAKRYGAPWGYPGDPRVILYMKIEHIAGQNL